MIMSEVQVLSLFGVRQTPEHYIFGASVVNAFITLYWAVVPLCLTPVVAIPGTNV